MRNFLKKNGNLIQLIMFLIIVIFAAGEQTVAVRQVDKKLDREVYNADKDHWQRELVQLQEQLNRIEVKIDAAIIKKNAQNTAAGRD